MIFPKAKRIAIELDWHKTKDCVFGLYKGYFFKVGDATVLSNPQFKYLNARIDLLTEAQKLQIKTELDNNKKILKFSSYRMENNSIFFQFFETLTYTKIKAVYSLLDFLVDLFKKLNIPDQNKCHNCGTKENIKYYDLNDSGVLLCDSCFRRIEDNYYEKERIRLSEEKGYLTGFLGSLVFSIPAMIVWVLVAVYLGWLASAMAMLIGFLGLKGYNYFKGRQSKLTKYVIVVSNILSILIANVATIIVMLVNEGLKLNESIAELGANEVAKDLLYRNTMISFVLAFFIWIWLLFIVKGNGYAIKVADKFVK